jgi:hypothetical protein
MLTLPLITLMAAQVLSGIAKAPNLGAQISSPFLFGIYVHYFDGVAVKYRNTIRGNREHLERIGSGISHRCLIGKHRHSHFVFVTL